MKNDDRNSLIHRNFGRQSDAANKGLFVLKSVFGTVKCESKPVHIFSVQNAFVTQLFHYTSVRKKT